MSQRVTMSFEQRFRLVDWLKKLGQDAIDNGRMSHADLAEKATAALGFTVTTPALKNTLPVAGLKSSAPLVERAKNNLLRPAPKDDGEHTRAVAENTQACTQLASAVLELAAQLDRLVKALDKVDVTR